MTTQTADAPPAPAARRRVSSIASPLHVAGAVAQLAALGIVGPFVFTALFSVLGAGLGLLFLIGVGVLVLIALVYVLFAVAFLENARVEGLYGFGIPRLTIRRQLRPGFGGMMRMFWRQAIDPAVWRAIANLAISTILGVLVVFLAGVVGSAAALTFAPLYASSAAADIFGIDVALAWAPVVGVLLLLASLAALIGLGLLHGLLSRLILVPSREAQLATEAREAGAQRAGAIRASEVERTRIERDLHDGVQPRLVSVGMTLGLARQKIDDDPAAAKALVEEAHTSTKAAITELRQLARGIHASVLDDRGLDAALSALAARSHVPVHLDVRIEGRCERTAEAAAYFAIAESLTNAAKHSRASGVRVVVRRRDDGTLWARVEDDGIGGARILAGGGLDGIANRVAAAGGTFRLDSPNGGPTALEVSVPCAS
ncbi:sensor histidine kinase [Microbacterium sp. P04]|uniref:sensor histidine kinase n=1 Tax=Microbacterium sp. P04 TaxID=3366947 RepID=UPI0037451192